MAPAKKQDRGASATKTAAGGEKPKKKTRKEKSVENREHWQAQNKRLRSAAHRTQTLAPIRAREDALTSYKDPNRSIDYDVDPASIEYTPELDRRLFRLIATAHSLEEISNVEGMPELFVLLDWRSDKDHPFGPTYLKAKEQMAAYMEELVVKVSTTPMKAEYRTTKQVLDRDGQVKTLVEVREADNVERARLAADAYKWNLAILQPKRYGRNADGVGGENDALKELLGQFRARNQALENET